MKLLKYFEQNVEYVNGLIYSITVFKTIKAVFIYTKALFSVITSQFIHCIWQHSPTSLCFEMRICLSN